ncbi:MAG: CapA family protein [Pseudomonadota bacterium]
MSATWPLLLLCVACTGTRPNELARSIAAGRAARVASQHSVPSQLASPTDRSFVLAAAGDVNLGRACGQRLLSDGSYDPWRGVASLWADADVRFVNLESVLSEQHGETQSPHHPLVFTGPPSGADALERAGIGLVSTANNHAWDYASRGLLETLSNLDRVGVAHAGTGVAEADAYRPAFVHVNGLTIALFAVTQVWNLGVFAEEEAQHHVAWADSARLREALRRARAGSDFVIVSYHGGEEYKYEPLPKTRAFAAEALRLGADAVIGHHPHVMQGVAWQDNKPIFYSLGNLVFDGRTDYPWTRAAFISKLRFRRGRAAEVTVCPLLIDGYEPRSLTDKDQAPRQEFERHLRELSDTVGGTSIGAVDAFGCYALTPPDGARATRLRDRLPVGPVSAEFVAPRSRTIPRAD